MTAIEHLYSKTSIIMTIHAKAISSIYYEDIIAEYLLKLMRSKKPFNLKFKNSEAYNYGLIRRGLWHTWLTMNKYWRIKGTPQHEYVVHDLLGYEEYDKWWNSAEITKEDVLSANKHKLTAIVTFYKDELGERGEWVQSLIKPPPKILKNRKGRFHKLTKKQMKEVVKLSDTMSTRQIGSMFGVSNVTIHNIIKKHKNGLL